MRNGAEGHADPTIGSDPGPTRHRRTQGTRPTPFERVPDRIWVPAVGALVLALSFVAALLVRADGDVSLLVHAAPEWTTATAAPDSLTVQPAGEGFDGQFFYRLGVHPWSTDEEVAGVTFDLPALRNARWGYGALAWMASGGDTDLVPWALVGVNVVAMAAVGAAGGGLARSSGRHAVWGLLFVLWPGFAYSLSMNTSELVASAFVLGGLLALRHRRWVPAALALSAAAITRDTTIVVATGMVFAGTWTWVRSRSNEPAQTSHRPETGVEPPSRSSVAVVLTGAVPMVVFGGWQLVQRVRFGELPITSSGDNNLSAPLAGLADQLVEVSPPSGGGEALRLVCIIGLVALIAAAAWAMGSHRDEAAPGDETGAHRVIVLGQQAAWFLAFGVMAVLNAYLWSGATAFMRATTEIGLLSTLVVLGAHRRPAPRLVALTGTGLGGLWLVTVAAQLSKLG